MQRPLGIELDRFTGTHLYVGDADVGGVGASIIEINIATGSRVQFSRPVSPVQQGPVFSEPVALRMDSQRVWLYALDTAGTSGFVFRILMNGFNRGDREVVASNLAGGGTGEELAVTRGLAYKATTGDLYIAQRNGEVLAHNLGTRVRTARVHSRIGAGMRIENPSSMVLEQATGIPSSLLITEPGAQMLVRMELANGNRTVISGGTVGVGTAFGIPGDVVLDRRPGAAGSALVLDLNSAAPAILSVNLSNGNRTALASIAPITEVRGFQLDAGANRVLFADNDFNPTNDDALYAVDLATQARTLVSGLARGGGTNFETPTRFVLVPATNPTRAILVERPAMLPSQLVSVDLATGNRRAFIENAGTPALPLVGPLFLDRSGEHLYGFNLVPQHLFEIPIPGTGAQFRSLISGAVPGSSFMRGTGPLPHLATALAFDASRGIMFVSASNSQAIFAIDVVSGERVMVSH